MKSHLLILDLIVQAINVLFRNLSPVPNIFEAFPHFLLYKFQCVFQLLRKLELVQPEDSAIPLLGTYPEDVPTCNKDTSFTMFITSLFIIARSWKEPICPSKEELIQKMWYIYTMEYYSAIKNNEFMKFLGKWMYLEDIILSEVTHSQKSHLICTH